MPSLLSLLELLPYPYNLLLIPFIAIIAIAAIIASGMIIRSFILFIINKWSMYKKVINAHDLTDNEYDYLHEIEQRFGFEQNHLPRDDLREMICKDLVSRGALIINKDGTYKVTRAGKRVSHEPRI